MTMTESILKSLMKLFAMVAQIHTMDKYDAVRSIVESYLRQLLRAEKAKQYLIMYDFYYSGFHEREMKKGEKQLSLLSVKAMLICEEVNNYLDKKQKTIILLQFLEILKLDKSETSSAKDFIRTVILAFKFTQKTFELCYQFMRGRFESIREKNALLFMDSNPRLYEHDTVHLFKEFLKGQIVFLWIGDPDFLLFQYYGDEGHLSYNGKPVVSEQTYLFEKTGVIKNILIGSIYFSDILKRIFQSKKTFSINFEVRDLHYSFPDGIEGIRPFNLNAEGGQLIGIVGGSGVGKSTLLSLLNGTLIPDKGTVKINGYDVHRNPKDLEGIIGYISQDDLLIEDLTVYQNIYFNAKLCFGDYSEEQIVKRIHEILIDLKLNDIKDLKVGTSLNKFISGGQRKRLNIALELIREPYVLFVDEPTSGLSSTDSDNVIEVLKQQSLKNKLVIVNIHQPSSDIFKRFDRILLMDEGGRIVFSGSHDIVIPYLKSHFQLIDAEAGECLTCGNIYPEQALQVLELRQVNKYGEVDDQRQMSAEDWYRKYLTEIDKQSVSIADVKIDLPKNDFKIPGWIDQFKVFWQRNILSKLADKQYVLINILEAPVLALILAWFTKYNIGDQDNPSRYIFSENVNLPVYIFMIVIVGLFLGLMTSAEEIIRDRKILKREKFLHLSRTSYYNSKVTYTLLLALLQSFLFILIGNFILEIKGMFFQYWIIMALTSFLASMLGLNISAVMRSVIAIYIMIPLLIIPQILMGGAMVRFEKLHSSMSNPKYVPVIGDLMPSRWSYEALTVCQFRDNKYESLFFEDNVLSSEASFKINYVIPLLEEKLDVCEANIRTNQAIRQTTLFLNLISEELIKISEELHSDTDWNVFKELDNFNLAAANKMRRFLKNAKTKYLNQLDSAIESKDSKIRNLSTLYGKNHILEIRNNHYNDRLAEIVLNKRELEKVRVYNNEIIRAAEPAYLNGESKCGRSHFYAPYKRLGNYYFDTYWLNFIVMLLITGVFYFLLIFEIIQRLLYHLSNLRAKLTVKYILNQLGQIYKPLI